MADTVFWNGKKVFITGNTGFKGSWLSLWLSHLGAQVYGYALKPPTQPNLYELCCLNQLVNTVIGDIRDLNFLQKTIKIVKPEIVIHMAAQPLVRNSYHEPVETYSINVMGTVNILEAARLCDSVRVIVNVTTDKCYENNEWCWGYRENDPLGGYDPYSNSKACSELITASYRNSFFNPKDYSIHKVATASARAGNVIGGGDWAKDRLIPDILHALLYREKIRIRNPEAIRPWQHVLEPLSGYLLLAQSLYNDGPKYIGSWNFGPNDDDAKPVRWILERLCKLWGENSEYEITQEPQLHEANYLKLDCSKAKRVLNWYPRWNLDHALNKVIEWAIAYKGQENLQNVCLKQIEEYINS